MSRVVGEVRPSYVFVENSAHLSHRGLDRIAGDLAALGYDSTWDVFSGRASGAWHERKRLFVLAWRLPDAIESGQRLRITESTEESEEAQRICRASWCHSATRETVYWDVEPELVRMVDGLADRVDAAKRISALGNGQIPAVAARAWRTLRNRIGRRIWNERINL
jgi:DNA (cytosine-5)-methyltransferase 1